MIGQEACTHDIWKVYDCRSSFVREGWIFREWDDEKRWNRRKTILKARATWTTDLVNQPRIAWNDCEAYRRVFSLDENAGYCRCSLLNCVKADFNSSSNRIFISMRCSATSKCERNDQRNERDENRWTNCIIRYWQRDCPFGCPDLRWPLRLYMMYKERTSREISEQSMPRHRYVEMMKNDYHRRTRRTPYLSPRKTSTASFIVGRCSLI